MGDMIGYVVVIFMWGVCFVQVFIMFFVMVDLLIGGKIVIDIFMGKNFIGVFW